MRLSRFYSGADLDWIDSDRVGSESASVTQDYPGISPHVRSTTTAFQFRSRLKTELKRLCKRHYKSKYIVIIIKKRTDQPVGYPAVVFCSRIPNLAQAQAQDLVLRPWAVFWSKTLQAQLWIEPNPPLSWAEIVSQENVGSDSGSGSIQGKSWAKFGIRALNVSQVQVSHLTCPFSYLSSYLKSSRYSEPKKSNVATRLFRFRTWLDRNLK